MRSCTGCETRSGACSGAERDRLDQPALVDAGFDRRKRPSLFGPLGCGLADGLGFRRHVVDEPNLAELSAECREPVHETHPALPLILYPDTGSRRARASPARTFWVTRQRTCRVSPLRVSIPEGYHGAHFRDIERYLVLDENRLERSAVELSARRADGHEMPLAISFERRPPGRATTSRPRSGRSPKSRSTAMLAVVAVGRRRLVAGPGAVSPRRARTREGARRSSRRRPCSESTSRTGRARRSSSSRTACRTGG